MTTPATAPLSDQELLDVLSQIDEGGTFAERSSSPLSAHWSASELLVDGAFESPAEFASLLDATLSPSDDGAESSASSPSGASPPKPKKSGAKADSRAPVAKPSRKRRKHELDRLRSLAETLETELRSIKKENDGGAIPGSAKLFWKRISDQVLVDKQKAMGENARLREVLRDQVRVVKSLQRSLAKSPDFNKLGIFPTGYVVNQTIPGSSEEVYSKLFRSIASSYVGMDAVFAQANIPAPSTDEARKVNMEMRTENGRQLMCMQVVESRLVPFSFLFIGEAAWTYLSKANDEERRTGFHRNDGDNLFGECRLNCSTGTVKLTCDVAMRRYVEKNRLAFVWESLGVVQNDPYAATKVVQMCLFEPSEDDPLHATVFRTCVHCTPTPVGEPQLISGSPIDVGIMTEMVLSLYEKTVAYIYSAVITDADVLDTLEYFALGPAPASGGSSSASISSAETPPRPHASTQRQELAYLRAKVRELELELRRAEQANGARLEREGDSLWQRVAQQQSVERQKALGENARLREQLEAQLRFSRALEKALRKRPSLAAIDPGGGAAPFERRKRAAIGSGKTLFEELAESAELELHRADAALRESGVHEIFRDYRNVDVRVAEPKDGAVIRVETVEARRFPFPFKAVARKWWEFISQSSQLEQVVGESGGDERHAVHHLGSAVPGRRPRHGDARDGRVPPTQRGRSLDHRVRLAWRVRRQEEPQGQVHYRRDRLAASAPAGVVSDPLVGVPLCWLCRRIRAVPLPGAPESCILQCAGQFIPTLCQPPNDASGSSDSGATATDTPVEAGILTEVIFSGYQKTANFIYAAIENALMEEHLKQQRHQQEAPLK
ncbi:hypothetical protein PybrP1_000103 [[Pythium] brassicae (nom. inval.)]|nr:hypothetical protein PybrP1_000103 [[Pythium] brassicae (nom. inval.)]